MGHSGARHKQDRKGWVGGSVKGKEENERKVQKCRQRSWRDRGPAALPRSLKGPVFRRGQQPAVL